MMFSYISGQVPTLSSYISILECASCAIKQNNQEFHEFDFETGPHRVCTSCFKSDTVHIFDHAVNIQHMANTAQAQRITSQITASSVHIQNLQDQLTAAMETQRNQRILLAAIEPDPLHSFDPAVVAQYQQNIVTARDIQSRIT